MLVAVIWPNAPAFVGMPAGLRLTVQLEMVVIGVALVNPEHLTL